MLFHSAEGDEMMRLLVVSARFYNAPDEERALARLLNPVVMWFLGGLSDGTN